MIHDPLDLDDKAIELLQPYPDHDPGARKSPRTTPGAIDVPTMEGAMKSTKVEIHGILHLDVDFAKLSESDVQGLRLNMAETFREEFDRMTFVGGAVANCEECSVSVEVS